MRSYALMKLKYFVLRMLIGCSLLIFALCVGISIIREILAEMDKNSFWAYVIGIVICVLILPVAAGLIYQAFNFERTVFGKNYSDYIEQLEELTQSEEDQPVTSNLIVTRKFIVFNTTRLIPICTLLPADDIVACFEMPELGSVSNPTDYKLQIYDRKYRVFDIPFKAKQVQIGHALKEKICQYMPWVYDEKPEEFSDTIVTRAGRRKIKNEIEKRKYDLIPKEDTDIEDLLNQ